MPGDFDRTFLERAGRELFAPGLRNQLYDEMPLFRYLMDGASKGSGVALIHKVQLFKNVSNGIVGGYGPMVTQEQNLLANATLSWANVYYANISLSWDEMLENTGTQGAEKLIDMLQAKTNAAKMELKQNVYDDLYGSRTTDGVYNTLVGLRAAIDTTNTYAGINRGTAGNEGWKANKYTIVVTDDTLADATTKATYLPDIIRTQWKNAAHDGSPNIIVTTKNIYGILEFIAERNNLNLMGPINNLGWGSVKMSGADAKQKAQDPPIFWDTSCPTKHLFGIATDKYKAWVFSGADFEPVDVFGDGNIWQRGDKQLAGYMTIAWKGQLLCEVPRENFVCTALGS